MELHFPTSELLPEGSVSGRPLCDYGDALSLMNRLISRARSATDALISVEHPPTITLGRRGGEDSILGRTLTLPGRAAYPVAVHTIARGGAVTYHAPGQLVIYPVVQLNLLAGPLGRGPLGDLGLFVRTLEQCIVATCARFGLETRLRAGFSGVWMSDTVKLASIGVGVRGGWTFHGLALNINPHLAGFELITPCALEGVTMTTVWRELEERGLPTPAFADLEADLLGRLATVLIRRPASSPAAKQE